LCYVGRVAVKDCFKLLSFSHLYLLFYYNLLTVLIMRVDMLKGINFNSGLNIYDTVVKTTKLTAHTQYQVTCAQGVLQNHT